MNTAEIILCNTTSGQLSRYSDSLRADGPGIKHRWEQVTFFSISVKTGPQTRPASPKGYRVYLPGVKRPRCGVDHQPPSRAEVKERVELYLYTPPVRVRKAANPTGVIFLSPSSQMVGQYTQSGHDRLLPQLRTFPTHSFRHWSLYPASSDRAPSVAM